MTTVPITLVFFYKGLIDYFIDRGFEVTVITSPDEQFIGKLSPRAQYILIPMFRGGFTFNDLRAFIHIRRILKKERFDIVQYCTPKAAFLGSIASWLYRIPVRLYLMWGIYYTSQTGLRRMAMKTIEKLICSFSTHVSPDSHGNRDFAISEDLCPAEKISVVGEGSASGIDLDRFDPDRLQKKRNEVRDNLNIPSDAIVIGFVGRLCRDKGINELVLAFKELLNKDTRLYLLLVGPMEGESREFGSAVQDMLQHNRNILRVGYQDNPEEFLAAMDIFVLPSYREGFGVVNIEASAMRLPVISTDIPGPRDAVLNGKTGILVKPRSVNELQTALESMISNPSLRRDMGVAGREWAKRFEQKSLWEEIVAHRETLLSEGRVPCGLNRGKTGNIPIVGRQSVLVTGANGFIGRNLCASLKERGYFVRGAVRNNVRDISGVDQCIQVGNVDESTDWQRALDGVDTVIHLAACLNIMDDAKANPIDVFRKVNVLGTGHLARMAAKAGVKRFIFISSVRVNGQGALRPYTEKDIPDPQDDYGVSKREAEYLLTRIAGETGLKIVILRLPLVYGPVVKAHFKNLIKIVSSGLPLPLKGINNRRSFIYLGNLMDAIITCINHPLAAGETFLVSDCADVSTPDLIKMIASAMKKEVTLFYLHPVILMVLCKIMGRSEELEKLTRTLTVDISKIKNLLGWRPPFTLEQGIRETVKCKVDCPSGPAVDLAMTKMKRIFDILLALILAALLGIPMLVVAVLIKLTSKGPVIFWTDRVGVNNTIFKMAKFRTMVLDTPQVATHLMKNHDDYITSMGKFLRKSSLDEMPQLFNILKADMTFVGPRPALFNQYDLIELRTKKNIHKLIPGVTGWAQVNGRDNLPIPIKVEFDEYYLKNRSLLLDLKIILMTLIKAVKGEDVQH